MPLTKIFHRIAPVTAVLSGLLAGGASAKEVPAEPGTHWTKAVDALSKKLHSPIISAVPSLWPRNSPDPSDVTAASLAKYLDGHGLRTNTWDGALCWSSTVGSPAALGLSDASARPALPEDGVARFLSGLTPEKLAIYSRGESIPLESLTRDEVAALKKSSIYPHHVDLFEGLGETQLTLFVTPTAFVFQRGINVTEVTPTPPDYIANASYSSWEGIVDPQSRRLLHSDEGVRDTQISIKASVTFSIGELPEFLSKHNVNLGRIIVSKPVRDAKVTVSSGIWPLSKFLGLIAAASVTEVQRISAAWLINPGAGHEFLRELNQPNSTLAQEIIAAETQWQLAEPLIRKLYQSPLSGCEKSVPEAELFGARLYSFKELTPAQQKWVLIEGLGWPEGTEIPETLTDSEDITVAFSPVLMMRATRGKEMAAAGQSLLPSYPWFLSRKLSPAQ